MSLSKATQITQNYAEVFRNLNGDYDEIISFFQDDISTVDHNTFTIYFDRNWKPVSSKVESGFRLSASYSCQDSIHQLSLLIFENHTNLLIYHMTVSKYSGLEVFS